MCYSSHIDKTINSNCRLGCGVLDYADELTTVAGCE